MIWFAWRQFRAQALTAAAVLLVFLAALALTWTQVTDLTRDTGFTGCRADACGDAAEAFTDALSRQTAGMLYYAGMVVLLLLPALLGMFWGVPLMARELETGTYRMIFSQSVSRRRWLLVKLAVGGVASALCAGLVSLGMTRWAAPIDQAVTSRVSPLVFTTRGIVPIAGAALAFVAGVVAGQVLRRTLTAMAVTLLVIVALQVATLALVPLLARPATSVTALNANGDFHLAADPSTNELIVATRAYMPGAWILSRTTVTRTGAEFKGAVDPTTCEPVPEDQPSDECRTWLATQNLRQELTYVPGSSFWALQWKVFGVLSLCTLGLSWLSLWWIRRRLA